MNFVLKQEKTSTPMQAGNVRTNVILLTRQIHIVYAEHCFRDCLLGSHIPSVAAVMSTICYSPTDAVSYWLNANAHFMRRRFVTMSFFLVDGYAYSRSFCKFFGVAAVDVFSSVKKNDANIIG